MITKEAWYLEVREILGEERRPPRGFKPIPRRPGQSFEEWYKEQEEAYQKYDKSRRHVLRYKHEQDIPRTEEQEEEQEIDELVREQHRAEWREWYRKKTQEDPKYHEEYLQRVKVRQEHLTPKQRQERSQREIERQRKKYRSDEGYAEKKRELARQQHEDQKRKMQEDPEYAAEVRRKNREKWKRRQERKLKDRQ